MPSIYILLRLENSIGSLGFGFRANDKENEDDEDSDEEENPQYFYDVKRLLFIMKEFNLSPINCWCHRNCLKVLKGVDYLDLQLEIVQNLMLPFVESMASSDYQKQTKLTLDEIRLHKYIEYLGLTSPELALQKHLVTHPKAIDVDFFIPLAVERGGCPLWDYFYNISIYKNGKQDPEFLVEMFEPIVEWIISLVRFLCLSQELQF